MEERLGNLKEEMKENVKKLEESIGHMSEELQQINKVAVVEKRSVGEGAGEAARLFSPNGTEQEGILFEAERYFRRNQ